MANVEKKYFFKKFTLAEKMNFIKYERRQVQSND